MTTLNPISDDAFGLIAKVMEPTLNGNWLGWLWDHQRGLWVRVWSPIRFPVGYVARANKTLNMNMHVLDVVGSMWLNGDDPDQEEEPSTWIQGTLGI